MGADRKSPMELEVRVEKWPLKAPLHIAGYTLADSDVVIVSLHADRLNGWGEAAGVYYRGESPATMLAQIEAVRKRVEAGVTQRELLQLLPPGGARNALDCALWDLAAKHSGREVWQLAEQPAPRQLLSTFTVGVAAPETMAQNALDYAGARAVKLKLSGADIDAERVQAVRAARPDVWLGVDANQGFTSQSLARLLPTLVETRVSLIEQPFPVGCEAWLDGLNSPIPLAADESVQDHTDLARLVGRVDVINIKLDKCGGLTEALAMAVQARKLGFELMVGNMGGSSLAIAPAFVLGQLCDVVDLDGPVFLTKDQSPGAIYEDGHIWCGEEVWGSPRTVVASRP